MNPSALFKNGFKHLLNRLGYEVYKRPYVPKGTDVYWSLRSHWPNWQPAVIFDVGANVGQSVARMRPEFPNASIFCFEPVGATFRTLVANLAKDPKATAYPLALGDAPGKAVIQVHPSSDQSSLRPELASAERGAGAEEIINIDTVDAFARAHAIERIGLLKIDVEGHELPVLQGALPLLASQRIDFIVAEAGLIAGNPRFTSLTSIQALVEPHGYVLIGVYEQYGVRYPQSAEFCNVLFAHCSHLS